MILFKPIAAIAIALSAAFATPSLAQKQYDTGASDTEIHDTVLIAAAFCMFNRYVDGLATWQPEDHAMYASMGEHLATEGYLAPSIKV